MRAFLLSLPLLCITVSARAQALVEVADQRTDEVTYQRIVPIKGDAWAFLAYENDPGGALSRNIIVARNGQGEPLWTIQGFPDAQILTGEIAPGPDSTILACSATNGCDVFHESSTIHRFNSDGSMSWARRVHMRDLKRIAIGATDQLAFTSPSEVLITNLGGDSLTSWTAPGAPVHTLCWTADGRLVIAASDTLYLTNTAGNILGTLPVPGGVRQLLPRPDSSIWVLRANELLVVSHDLQPQAAFDLSGSTSDAKRLTGHGNDAWLLTPDSIIRVDAVLGPGTSFPLDTLPGHSVVDLGHRAGRIVTSGNAQLFTTRAGVMRTYDTTGNTARHDEDVAISVASVDSVWLRPIHLPSSVYSLQVRVTVTVENRGTSVVDTLLLAQRTGGFGPICGVVGTILHLSRAGLQPGQSMNVQMPVLHGQVQTYPPGSTARVEYCIVAASPNNVVDRFPADNRICFNTAITGVGIATADPGPPFSVFPNPFHDELFVETGDAGRGPWDVALLDPLGRTVHSERLVPTSRLSLTLPPLPDGLYVLSIREGDRHWTQRLVRTGN